MLQRLHVRDKEKPENARRRFDGQLTVRAWGRPGKPMTEPDPQQQATPWWWAGAEDASQSFLASMGVTLE
jgi:hypothetical protein